MSRTVEGPYRMAPRKKAKKVTLFGEAEWKQLRKAGAVEDSLDAEFGASPRAPKYGKISYSEKFR